MQGKIRALAKHEGKIVHGSSQFPMIELLSLTYKQLYSFGFGLLAPIILAILLGSIIIALSILGAMGAL